MVKFVNWCDGRHAEGVAVLKLQNMPVVNLKILLPIKPKRIAPVSDANVYARAPAAYLRDA